MNKPVHGVCCAEMQPPILFPPEQPENFLYVSPDSDVIKAIDFGLSDFFTPTTKFTNITGSPYYVAPEVRRSMSQRVKDLPWTQSRAGVAQQSAWMLGGHVCVW